MSKPARQTSELKKLELLSAFDPAADGALQNALIKQCLEDRHVRVVAKAATLAGEHSLRDQIPALLNAYAGFLQDPVKRDPNCMAKQAIVRALVALECDDTAFFLQGIRFRQLEPVWGGSADTAIDIRNSCAMGLVATGYSRTVQELTALLHDPESRARAGAARAISCGNPREAESLLRFKVLVGDPEPEVIGECFTGLLTIAKDECLPFVARYLADDNDAVREFAALALGDSRHPQSLEHIRAAWDAGRNTPDFRAALIRAAALLRTTAAFDWLASIIEHGSRAHADIAVEALSIYERNTKLSERVHAALEKRKDAIKDR